ncbi:androgen-dependent TFPI-regulating protein-like isoform X3 [Odontomachus brunneus]|nr:androgen-dependent TFPI-regulating protein-like isoform X3 [Odontomachus brunneus]XP_032677855.1 androgen-dependent TFPI-regulating protein-like isoform X3 [Odontomachus brunneus]XP_032677861.1 androgen-dependent TFPI-regulating protein-like isoform X3 [Odontomachus brunneus]XP_032677868.1 androgen-dependent TFPI-regulating protein-like isoform X3 [Odontomachus brunneus]
MANILNTLVHLLNILAYGFTLYYASFILRIPFLENKFKDFDPGQFKYLTIWNVILQAVFFLICVLNDCFGTNAVNPKKRPFVRKLKDSFHASLGFPIAMFVGIIFWILMFVDRELVLPKAIDPYFPWWLNHLMHTMIMVTTVLEMIVAPRQYPKRSRGLTILVSFMLMYLVWIHVIYFKSGFWVYPVMEVLTLPLRIVFIVSLLVVCIVLYFVGETLDNYLWGKKCVAVTESVDPDLKT